MALTTSPAIARRESVAAAAAAAAADSGPERLAEQQQAAQERGQQPNQPFDVVWNGPQKVSTRLPPPPCGEEDCQHGLR